jgi:glycerophosphoryl diester phosphodiesterase
MAAFERAIRDGAEGIELDVHMTADGEIVVIHDETLDRTAGVSVPVADLTLREIRRLDAGSWFSPEHTGEKIPLLSEVLELLRDTDLELNIELKNGIVRYPGLEEKVVREAERIGMDKRVILSSFNHFSLRHLRVFRPDFRLAALYECGLVDPWVYARYLGVDGIHPHYLACTEEVVSGCRKAGIHVRPYTVDDPDVMRRLLRAGVDAIITNVPARLKEVREAFARLPGRDEKC